MLEIIFKYASKDKPLQIKTRLAFTFQTQLSLYHLHFAQLEKKESVQEYLKYWAKKMKMWDFQDFVPKSIIW